MGSFSIWHWIIVLVIVVLVFGTKKLRNLGGDLGGALKGFKEGMKESDTENTLSQSAHVKDPIIEVEARKEPSANTFKNSAPEEHRAPINHPVPPVQGNQTTTENNPSQPIAVNNQIIDAEIKDKTQAKA